MVIMRKTPKTLDHFKTSKLNIHRNQGEKRNYVPWTLPRLVSPFSPSLKLESVKIREKKHKIRNRAIIIVRLPH